MKNIINNLLIIIIVLCLLSCKKIKENKVYSNYSSNKIKLDSHNYIDSLEGDFNFDNKIDILRIEKTNNDKLLFNIYENKSTKPKLSLKNIIYNIGDLKPTPDFLSLSFEKGNLIITQEYGSQNPDGWFICYIRNKKGKYIVDSISNSHKEELDDRIDVVKKTKTINKNIKKINLITLFNNLSQ